MTAPALIRPPRVTTACLFIGFSCLMALLYVTSTLSNWGSIEVREQVRTLLASDPLKSAGLDVTDVMGWLRWALMGVAAVAVAGIVFSIYTAMGHQASRVILTVMCGLGSLVFLTGGLFGILPAAFSIFCGIYLWTPDSRQWFAIKNGKMLAPEIAERIRPDPFATPVAPPVVEQTGVEPPTAPAPAATPRSRAPIPKPVLGAGLTALILSSLVALGAGFTVLTYAVARNELVRILTEDPLLKDRVRETGMGPAEIANAMFVGSIVFTVLALLAVAAAAATLAGMRAGRTLLVVLAILTLLISILAFPVGLMWTAGAVATLVLLRRPEARDWFACTAPDDAPINSPHG